MATKPPSDADIFLDDDGPSNRGGSAPTPSPVPKTPAANPKPAPTSKPPSALPASKRVIAGKEFKEDFIEDLRERLVKAPKAEMQKIQQALTGLSGPRVSIAERIAFKRAITEANQNLKKIEKENREYVKTHQRFKTVQMDSAARLAELRKHLQDPSTEFTPDQLKALEAMEDALIDAVQKSVSKNHKDNIDLVKLLDQIDKQTEDLPKELKKRFEELDAKTSRIVQSQHEAAALVAETNKKMRDASKRAVMGALDFVGLGGIVRGVGKVASGIGSVGKGAKATYRYVQARRIIAEGKRRRAGKLDDHHYAAEQRELITPAQLPANLIPPAEVDPNDPLTRVKESKKGKKTTAVSENAAADAATKAAEAIEKAKARQLAQAAIANEAYDPWFTVEKKAAAKRKKRERVHSREVGSEEDKIVLVNFTPEMAARITSQELKRILTNARLGTQDKKSQVKSYLATKRPRDAQGRFLKEGSASPSQLVSSGGSAAADERQNAKEQAAALDQYQTDSLKNQKDLNNLVESHAIALARFNERLLEELKGSSPKASGNGAAMYKALTGLAAVIGPLGPAIAKVASVLGPLAGMLGKFVAVAGAFMAGHWLGTQIWKAIEDAAGKKFNNLSGNDAAGAAMTAPVQLNTQENFDRAQKIHKDLQTPGSKMTGADQDFYAAFRRDNPNVNLDKAYAPTDRQKLLNKPKSGEAAPQVQEPVKPVQVPAPAERTSGGRGSVHPEFVKPTSDSGKESGRVRDFMGKIFTKNGNVDVDGLHPQMQSTLVSMGKEYNDATGKKLQFNSAFRSLAEQERLYRTKPPGMAARPGSSLHNFGLAVDIPGNQVSELEKLGLLGKYGFTRPIKNEPWHVQPAGISVASAKQGIYSADAPSNQDGRRPGIAVARQSAPSVTNAEYEAPASANSPKTPGLNVGAGTSGGAMGGTRVSTTSIPTFDNSDGMFLALNTGIV